MHEPVLRAAAFGGEPLPDPAVLRGARTPTERLLAAIVLGAQGRYAAAATLLGPLRTAKDPLQSSLAASTLAAHRRQLGGHANARALDGEAFARAAGLTAEPDPDGLDAAGARADALLGLAADNLALGRLSAARRLAERAADQHAGWRATVRGGWVGAEIELAAGRGAAAVAPAERAFETAVARGARRHAVKSGIVLAVALRAAAAPDHRKISDDLVGKAMATAEECELFSLLWPAALVAADLRPGHAEEYRFRVAEVLHAVLRSADPCGRRIAEDSPWVPAPGG
ncbi:hypothetical protein ACIOD2_17265 [Amycolatopsis sp. NPDC088138]|uniref:hypothetical protein n=1 Tax=Amycolatopsis sp. NPDC088138 TaxID=3363938 RepID=UPI00381BE450